MSTFLLFVIMLAAGIGMVVSLVKQRRGAVRYRPVTLVCALIALACALTYSIPRRFPDPGEGPEGRYELEYLRIGTETLGRYLAQKYPDSTALVLVDPPSPLNRDRRVALLEGLRRGFNGKITIGQEASPERPPAARRAPDGGPRPGQDDISQPMDYWLTREDFDSLVEKHLETCELVVSMIGVPADAGKMRLWTLPNRPKLALASGSVFELRSLIANGGIVAAVAFSPEAVFSNERPPSDVEEAFEKRFLLLTPENVEGLADKFEGQGLFM